MIKYKALLRILSLYPNKFNKFNTIGAKKLDSIYLLLKDFEKASARLNPLFHNP